MNTRCACSGARRKRRAGPLRSACPSPLLPSFCVFLSFHPTPPTRERGAKRRAGPRRRRQKSRQTAERALKERALLKSPTKKEEPTRSDRALREHRRRDGDSMPYTCIGISSACWSVYANSSCCLAALLPCYRVCLLILHAFRSEFVLRARYEFQLTIYTQSRRWALVNLLTQIPSNRSLLT